MSMLVLGKRDVVLQKLTINTSDFSRELALITKKHFIYFISKMQNFILYDPALQKT